MRWQSNPLEGWHTGFAWFPVATSDGFTVWLETYRYYVSRSGWITTILRGK